MIGLIGKALQDPCKRCGQLQVVEAAFEDVDRQNDVPVLGCTSFARLAPRTYWV